MADFHTRGLGQYRSKDPIENFKIRVRLKKLQSNSLVTVPIFDDDGGAEMQNVNTSDVDSYEYTFSWQEKVFNKEEIEFYKDKKNCENQMQLNYHDKVMKLEQDDVPYNRLFSFTNSEAISNAQSDDFNDNNSNFLIKRMNELRQKSTFVKPPNSSSVLPGLNIIDDKPSDEFKKTAHAINTPVQTMHLMADLKSNVAEDDGVIDKHLLCKIQIDSNNVISVVPDFNTDLNKPYVIEHSCNQVKETYHYTIEHASTNISESEKSQEQSLYRELCNRYTEYIASCISPSFQMPPSGVLKLVLNGEIVSAQNFQYDHLYAHYFLDLSNEWSVISDTKLSGVTQRCKTKTIGQNEVAYFSYPFSMELQLKMNDIDNSDELPKWPVLFIEVLSLDSWNRFRTEGYGHVALPYVPGMFKKTVNTWRPLADSHVSLMRRFFIGASPRLDTLTSAALPSNFQGKQCSKLGFRTIASGSVDVRLNILHQSQSYLSSENQKKKIGSLIDRLGAAAIHNDVAAVFMKYRRERQKMLAARDLSSVH